MDFDELSNAVIGCAIEVHKQLAPGLLGKKGVAGFWGRMYDGVQCRRCGRSGKD